MTLVLIVVAFLVVMLLTYWLSEHAYKDMPPSRYDLDDDDCDCEHRGPPSIVHQYHMYAGSPNRQQDDPPTPDPMRQP